MKKKEKPNKSKKKSNNKGLNKKQKRNCQKNPTNYSYCPVPVIIPAAIQLSTPSPGRMLHTHTIDGRKLIQNDMGLTPGAVTALETTIKNMLDPPFDVISVTITSITATFLVTYDVVLNLPQGTTKEQAQDLVDDALSGITDEEFQDDLQTNLSDGEVTNCGGVLCSDLTNVEVTVVSRFSYVVSNIHHNAILILLVSSVPYHSYSSQH